MGRNESTVEFDHTYSFARYALNQGVPPSALRLGEFSKLAGVDGRYRGALRVFPGFTDLNWGFSLADHVVFRGFEVQKGTTDTVLRGFLVLYDSGGGTYKLELKYYDGSWKTFTINSSFTGSQNDIDISVAGKFLHITGVSQVNIPATTQITGSGLDDITTGGTFTGTTKTTYLVTVNGTPSPDTFTVLQDGRVIQGTTNITGSAQSIGTDGVTITWGATEGHTNGDQWKFTPTPGGPNTVWWDEDSDDFITELMGSEFNDGRTIDGVTTYVTDKPTTNEMDFPSSAIDRTHQILEDGNVLRLTDEGSAGAGGNAFLGGGNFHLVAYRFKDTRRNVYSPLSQVLYGRIDPAGGASVGLVCFITDDFWENHIKGTARWNRMEIFRTIANGFVLYKEWEVLLSAETGAGNALTDVDVVAITFGGDEIVDVIMGTLANVISTKLTTSAGAADVTDFKTLPVPHSLDDTNLALQLAYDKTRDSTIQVPPRAIRIGSYQGITFIQDRGIRDSIEDENGEQTNTAILYSPLQAFRPENFPAANIIPIPQKDGEVQQFQEAGDFMWSGTANALWRFQRSGSRMAANRVNVGWGISDKGSMIEANNDLFVAMRRGLLKIQAGSGTPVLLAAVERIMLDDWRAELASAPDTATPGDPPKIQLAFDATLGAVFVLNRIQKEMIVVWTATGQITTLEDVPWDLVTTLPGPVNGGSVRAWFTKSDDGRIYRADPERDETLGPTMLPTHAAVEGTATEGTTTTLDDSTQSFTSDIIGHVIYVDTGSGYEKATVTARTGTQLTFSAGLSGSGDVDSGDRYVLSPIRFNAVAAPLPGHTGDDRFYRRVIHGMWAQPDVISGTPNADGRWTYEAYRQSSDTPSQTTDATWDAAGDLPEDLSGYLPHGGTILRPGWLCVEPSVHYELLSGRVNGKVKANDKVK